MATPLISVPPITAFAMWTRSRQSLGIARTTPTTRSCAPMSIRWAWTSPTCPKCNIGHAATSTAATSTILSRFSIFWSQHKSGTVISIACTLWFSSTMLQLYTMSQQLIARRFSIPIVSHTEYFDRNAFAILYFRTATSPNVAIGTPTHSPSNTIWALQFTVITFGWHSTTVSGTITPIWPLHSLIGWRMPLAGPALVLHRVIRMLIQLAIRPLLQHSKKCVSI